jgi:IclR family KDG regulon transcriptional repressor
MTATAPDPMTRKEKSTYTIQSVCHALDLLEQFHEHAGELGQLDMGRRMKLSKNKIFRLLATLESHKYIHLNTDTGKYRLGLKLLELGQAVGKQMKLLNLSRPVIESMAKACNEAIYVATLKDFSIMYLDAIRCDHPIQVVSPLGRCLPAYCTAAGKVQIAGTSDEALKKYLFSHELRQYTPHTITDRENLKQHLHQIALQGYATDNQELELGAHGVGAPIRDYTRRIVGAVSVSCPSERFSRERMESDFIPLVTDGARDISTRLGYH